MTQTPSTEAAPLDIGSLRDKDVLRYHPASSHCRAGLAYVSIEDDGTVMAHDIYWASGDNHRLSPGEMATAEVYFNLDDYTTVASERLWQSYAPEHRARLRRQGQYIYFVRNGSQPDINTRIFNARCERAERREDVRAAESALKSAQRNLDYLLELGGFSADIDA